ncbi:MAG: PAS domain S-box protein [Deltaproteobacteria bacterium]|nr:PAS domain S-box protein [Deltaproteobacteria bacterium]
MISGLAVILIFCLYVGLLFCVALWAERRSASGKSLVNNPWVYSLSLAVYCTSWTFFGSVGLAATQGFLFLAIYLGPSLAALCFPNVLKRMVVLKNTRHITSIADFLSSRYEKSESLAAVVTLICLVGTLPYVALQFKAFLATFDVITTHQSPDPGWVGAHLGPVMVGLMILFTIMFGVRRLDPTERHDGMVMAVALESLVKLVAFLAVGLFVVYGLFGGMEELFANLAQHPAINHDALEQASSVSPLTWSAYLILSANAVILLPRQFHVAVVENQSVRHLRWAMWLFPLYLLLINLFVYPVAQGGLLLGYPWSEADTFLLQIPLDQGNQALALLVFIGGFSAATSMILISSMTMATMISNHLLLPLVDWIPQLSIIERHILRARWIAVAGFILLGYCFERLVGEKFMLANIGIISFAAVLQLAPATLGGMFWRRGTKRGAMWGMLAGFLAWTYTMLLPMLVESELYSHDVLTRGPLGHAWLRPQELFGLGLLDPTTHSVFWSLFLNVVFYVLGSILSRTDPASQRDAEAFVGVLSGSSLFQGFSGGKDYIPLDAKRRVIEELMTRYFGPVKARRLTEQALAEVGLGGMRRASITRLAELYDALERILGGSIGTATAHRVLSRAEIFTPSEERDLRDVYAQILANLRARPEDLKRKIDFYQEREALITRHAEELEEKVRALEEAMAKRREAEDRLRESEERYRLAIEYSSDGVTIVKDGRMIFINRKLAEIFGYRWRRELIGRSLTSIVHPEDQERVLSFSLHRQGGRPAPSRYDFKGLRKNGQAIYIAVSATTINFQGETLILAYLRDVTQRRQAEEEIHNLSQRLIAGSEEERRRLAADLHDEFGQALTALHMGMESILDSIPSADLRKQVQGRRLIDKIEDLAENLRHICTELRPDMLDHLGLVPTVEWYVDEFRERMPDLTVELQAAGFGKRKLNSMVEIAIYRILQESLNNVVKHAQAKRVRINLTYSHPQVILVVSDDGVGLSLPENPLNAMVQKRGIGLISMKERVAAAGGMLDIKSAPGKGTTIRVSLPANGAKASAPQSFPEAGQAMR